MTAVSEQKDAIGGEGGIVLTADAIARAVDGTLVGDGDAQVYGVAPIDRATDRDLTFLAGARHMGALAGSRAAVVLVSPENADALSGARARVIVADPQAALVSLLPRFALEDVPEPGVHPTAVLGRGARLGADVSIGPYAVIAEGVVLGDRVVIGAHCLVGTGVRVGDGSRLYPQVTLYAGAEVGRRVTIHSGARIASDGFGYIYRDHGHAKIPHVGRCVIGESPLGCPKPSDRSALGANAARPSDED